VHRHRKPLYPLCSCSGCGLRTGPKAKRSKVSEGLWVPYAFVAAAHGQKVTQAWNRRFLSVTWAMHVEIMHWCKYISHFLQRFSLDRTQQEHWVYPWTIDTTSDLRCGPKYHHWVAPLTVEIHWNLMAVSLDVFTMPY